MMLQIIFIFIVVDYYGFVNFDFIFFFHFFKEVGKSCCFPISRLQLVYENLHSYVINYLQSFFKADISCWFHGSRLVRQEAFF